MSRSLSALLAGGVLLFSACSITQPVDAPDQKSASAPAPVAQARAGLGLIDDGNAASSEPAPSAVRPSESKQANAALAEHASEPKAAATTTVAATLESKTAEPPRASDDKPGEKPSTSDKLASFRKHVDHIVVIYQENWSFDGLYGKFPHANGVANAGAAAKQVDRLGIPYIRLPPPKIGPVVDPRFVGADLPVAPFDLAKFVTPEDRTGDLIHAFYHEQAQIDGGKMDKFVSWSDAAGLVMSYYDATNLPEGKLAQQYTLCDNFFHSAFGGSFLNHMYLIAAAAPRWPDAPPETLIRPGVSDDHEGQVTEDGYAVNTAYSVNQPHRRNEAGEDLFKKRPLLPNQTMPTIGDRLSEKKVSWAWFAGGWDMAMAGSPDPRFNDLFQYHHHPFTYFANYADGTPGKAAHLKDEEDFLISLKSGTLPAVSFIKPFGEDNEHPGYASLMRGQAHAARLVNEVRDSDYWPSTVVIICYDEHGGRWDHVAPPVKDRFGPGSRVPAIVISPFKQTRPVDHTQYETCSILKLIEERFDLAPLTDRDRDSGDMLNAFVSFEK